MTERKSEVIQEQNNLIESFESSNGVCRRRIDTAQIWLDKDKNIADAAIRKRVWRFGVLTHDYLQVINNYDSNAKSVTGFKTH